MADFNVAGRQFRTQSDYNAALRDQKQIEAIKAKINMEQPGEVISLAEELKAGKIRLTTIVGTDFKEEIQELAESIIRIQMAGLLDILKNPVKFTILPQIFKALPILLEVLQWKSHYLFYQIWDFGKMNKMRLFQMGQFCFIFSKLLLSQKLYIFLHLLLLYYYLSANRY